MTVRKHFQAHGAAATRLVLLLLIVTSLTVPVMLSSLPLAAADEKADCEKSGGTYQVKDGNSHCFVTLPTDTCTMGHMDVPDPELCLRGGISNDPTPSACSTTEGGTNNTAGRTTAEGRNQSTTSELRMQIEEACIALQTGDTPGAMLNIDLTLTALGRIGDNGTQVANITNTTTTASGATNATTTNTTTGTNATQEVDQSINSTASEMEGPGDPIKGIPMGGTETPTEEEAGGGNNPSTATTTEPTTTTTTDGDDMGTPDTGGEGETGEGGSSDDVDRGDAD